MNESIFNYLPKKDEKTNFRLQCSLSLEEAGQLEKLLLDPNLPFGGNMTAIIRTFVQAGIMQVHKELEEDSNSFIQAIQPVLGSELLKWSQDACDRYAISATDHLYLAADSDVSMAQDVLTRVASTVSDMKDSSAKAMLKRALIKRGFLGAINKLRQIVLEEDGDVYWIDTQMSDNFSTKDNYEETNGSSSVGVWKQNLT